MGTKVTVITSSKNRVSINNQQRSIIRSVSLSTDPFSRNLSDLLDVDATNPDNNETLVYDAESGKYILKPLPNIDGGTF